MNYLLSAGIMPFSVVYVLKTKTNPVTNHYSIHYTNSSGCAPTFVGKQSKNHVCGPQGHEDGNRDLSTTSTVGGARRCCQVV
jgi:hypothetical protein